MLAGVGVWLPVVVGCALIMLVSYVSVRSRFGSLFVLCFCCLGMAWNLSYGWLSFGILFLRSAGGLHGLWLVAVTILP